MRGWKELEESRVWESSRRDGGNVWSSWKVCRMGACPWEARDSALVFHWHHIHDRNKWHNNEVNNENGFFLSSLQLSCCVVIKPPSVLPSPHPKRVGILAVSDLISAPSRVVGAGALSRREDALVPGPLSPGVAEGHFCRQVPRGCLWAGLWSRSQPQARMAGDRDFSFLVSLLT